MTSRSMAMLRRPMLLALRGARQCATVRTAPKLRLISGACEIPHPQKRSTGGEDAWFVCSNTVGVADGVGGWARKGVDSGEYSRTLMSFGAHSDRRGTDGEE
ncbi:hypothetical protein PINS_up016572 [Pythium insidiosum]|nr:hypothetical protein PINS_up016572 [Pythium insidiosum]